MISVTVSSVALALFTACELSTGARRLGADLLGSAAGCSGTITEAVENLAGRVGVSWNRARVLLGELSRAGFVTYWSYTAAGQRWCCVSWLAWVVGVPRVLPPPDAGEDFTQNVSGKSAQPEAHFTRNVSGDGDLVDCDRSEGIRPRVVVVQQTNSCCLDIKQTTTACAHAHVCVDGDVASGTSPVTENVSGDPDADRILALLTDPEVGMPVSLARRSASFGDFWRVVGNVFEWRRQRDAGTLRSPHAALSHRLLKGWEGVILDADRYSELWDRHCRPALAATYTRNVLGDGSNVAEPIAAEAIGTDGMASCEQMVTRNVSGVSDDAEAAGPTSDVTRNVSGVKSDTETTRPASGVTQNVSDEKSPAETWWEQVVAESAIEAGGTYERWLNDTTLVSYDASDNSFVVGVPDRYRIDWLRNRMTRGVARKLSVMTRRQATVSFILAVDALPEAA